MERWDGQRIASERKRVTREARRAWFDGSEVSAAVEEVQSAIAADHRPTHADAGFDPATPMPSSEYALTECTTKNLSISCSTGVSSIAKASAGLSISSYRATEALTQEPFWTGDVSAIARN